MKLFFTRLTLIMVAVILLSGPSFASHEVTRWRDNRTAAVSLTFDDGYVSQYTACKDLLNARNFKGTFFLTTERVQPLGGWEPWRELFEQGHEIGSHTITHPHLPQLSETKLREELSQSQDDINLNISNQSCLTLAYPYGDYNDFVKEITSEYYIAGRATWVRDSGYLNHYPGDSSIPVNFYCIASYRVDDRAFEEIQNHLNLAEESNAWLCAYTHDVDSEYVPVLSAFYDDLLVRDIWVDTLVEIVRYMRERIHSTLDIISETDTEITLNLTHTLDHSIYNAPVTIRRTVPSTWTVVHVYQGGSEYIIEPVLEEDEIVVYYDVVPTAGLITLSPGSYVNQAPSADAGPDQTILFSLSESPVQKQGDESKNPILLFHTGSNAPCEILTRFTLRAREGLKPSMDRS